jgi:hypothetical protein
MDRDSLGVLLISFGLLIYSIITFLKGYKYNEKLQQYDQGSSYNNNNDSWLDEFFRLIVPYFPIKIAKFLYMGLGITLFLLSLILIIGIFLY